MFRTGSGALIHEVKRICTPKGYKVQCYHQQGAYLHVDGKSQVKRSIDEEQWIRSLLQSFNSLELSDEQVRLIKNKSQSRTKRGSRISNVCCQDGCDDEYLETFCCDDNEFNEFKKLHSVSR
uniref:Insulin-like domain-containing protein n=1 Tax=Ditylenchus dipsaci TaxID=166011 RepID=A0A915ECT4_9BILA